MTTIYKIDIILNSDSKLYHNIDKISIQQHISFDKTLEALVTKGLYRHLSSNLILKRPQEFKDLLEERIISYETRCKTLDVHTIYVEFSTDIEFYQMNLYQSIEKLASIYSTSFDTILAILIQDGLDSYLKYEIKWALPQDFSKE